jgi:hypothetical protein
MIARRSVAALLHEPFHKNTPGFKKAWRIDPEALGAQGWSHNVGDYSTIHLEAFFIYPHGITQSSRPKAATVRSDSASIIIVTVSSELCLVPREEPSPRVVTGDRV